MRGLEELKDAAKVAATLKGQAGKQIRAQIQGAIATWEASYSSTEEITSLDLTPSELADVEVIVEEVKSDITNDIKSSSEDVRG